MKMTKIKAFKGATVESVKKYLSFYKVHYIPAEGFINEETIIRSFKGDSEVDRKIKVNSTLMPISSGELALLIRWEMK